MPRMFGVEIEFVFGTAGGFDEVLAAVRATGVQVIDNRFTHQGHDRSQWTLKRDGSIGARGGEIVSPPLDFDNATQRNQVTLVLEALQAAGCNSDASAGIHIHVECADFTPKQLAAVLRFSYKFEDALFRVASSGWETMRDTRWCNAIPEALVSDSMRIRRPEDIQRLWFQKVGRYMMVNVHAWYRQGTLEFRLFNSTLNPKRLQGYLALVIAIVQDARVGYSRSTKKHFPVGYMADNGNVAEKSVLLKLQQILRYQSGMTDEDWQLFRFLWKDSRPQIRSRVRVGFGDAY